MKYKWQKDVCKNIIAHTPQPDGYLQWHAWAETMYNSNHRQVRCPECGLWAIWIKKNNIRSRNKIK